MSAASDLAVAMLQYPYVTCMLGEWSVVVLAYTLFHTASLRRQFYECVYRIEAAFAECMCAMLKTVVSHRRRLPLIRLSAP